MTTTANETTPRKNRTWSLFAGIGVIYLSFWALHTFCDGYSESILTRQVAPRLLATEGSTTMPAETVCSQWLGLMTLVGAAGVCSLLAAWTLQVFSKSRSLLQLASGLAVAGRLIALGSLGAVVLVLVLFTRFADLV